MKVKKSLVLAAAVAAVVAAPGAFATNGYMSHGRGMEAKAMGGVGIALPQGGMAAATNPATQMYVGNKLTFGMDWFRPFYSATRVVSATVNDYRDGATNDFYAPEFGYTTPIGTSSSLGVVVYGDGLGSDYGVARSGFTAAGRNLYMLLKYMYIAPTWAMKVGNHSFGASLNIVKGNVDVRGVDGFVGFSATPDNLSDKGEDGSSGIGVKLGWIGELTPAFSLGATYQPRTNMTKFSRYKGMLAEQGDADVPTVYGLGLAWKASPATVVGFDVTKIKYSTIKAFANSANSAITNGGTQCTVGACMGNSDGLGFGWKDQTVYKLGVSHQLGKWTLRAGYNYAKSPIGSDETLFNTMAPAVTEKHYTLGAGWAISNSTDLSLAFMYSPSNEVKGSGTHTASGNVNPDLKMNQNSLGISLNVKM